MLKYILKRFFLMIPTLLGITLICFILVRMAPGDPILVMLGRTPTSLEEIEKFRSLLGLDDPLYIQYFKYLLRIVQGDWGLSIVSKEPVLPLLLQKFLLTMQLAILAVTLGSLIGILMGFIAVMRRGSLIDSTCRIVSSISYSMPTFWSGLLLMYIFAVRLKWLPAGGGGDIRCSILPALNLTIYISGWTSRVTRASMLDVLVKDYVLAARAKGLPPRVLLYKHVFKNALIPVFTTIGLQLGSLLGGAFITETIFNYPGLGWLIITYIFRRDYPVIQGGILLAGIAFCFVNLIVDVLYTYLDPRVRYEKKS